MLRFPDQAGAQPVYRCQLGAISSLQFSPSGRYLGIGSVEQMAVVYDSLTKRFTKCRPGHSGSVKEVQFSPDEKLVCSTAADGFLKVYRLDEEDTPGEWRHTNSFHVCPSPKAESPLVASFNPKGSLVAVPGRPVLQQVEVTPSKISLMLNPNIKHDSDLAVCFWQSNEILVTCCLGRVLAIWNFHTAERLACVQDLLLTRIARHQQTFFGIDSRGSLHEFQKPALLRLQPREDPSAAEASEQQSQQDMDAAEEDEEELLELAKPTKSKADKIMSCLPQPAVGRSTSFFRNNRFLFYNEVGCIIERLSSESQSIEVEYHGPTARRNRSLFLNRELRHFAISHSGDVAYAGDSEFGLLGEDSWEHRLPGVQGVVLGSHWLAALTDEAIHVFDQGGNQLRSIAFDRQIVAAAGYEQLLAVVYHDGVPMWGCQSLRMSLFELGEGDHRLLASTFLPLKLQSLLKCFGFSAEGMLYSQDSKGAVRVYSFDRAEWGIVHDPAAEEEPSRLWLVGMANYELLAFQLPQDELEPTVQPRPTWARLPVCVPTVNTSALYLNKSTNRGYGAYLWRLATLAHEHFRHEMWSKLRVSREKTHPLHALSATVPTEEQLKRAQEATELDFLYLVKNLLANGEADRAYLTVKTYVKTDKLAAKLAQIFEDAGLRELAIKIETFFEEKARERQYEAAVRARLDELKGELQAEVAAARRLAPSRDVAPPKLITQPPVMPFVQKVTLYYNLDQYLSSVCPSRISR